MWLTLIFRESLSSKSHPGLGHWKTPAAVLSSSTFWPLSTVTETVGVWVSYQCFVCLSRVPVAHSLQMVLIGRGQEGA